MSHREYQFLTGKPLLPRAIFKIGVVHLSCSFLKQMHVLRLHSSIPTNMAAIAAGILATRKVMLRKIRGFERNQ